MRNVFDLPRSTHRFLIEPISEFSHLFTLLTNRFLNFYNTLYDSGKDVIYNLRRCQENDCRSSFGINIKNICQLNNTYDIHKCSKYSIKYFPINDNERWRVNILKELIDFKNATQINGFTKDEINLFIENVACA